MIERTANYKNRQLLEFCLVVRSLIGISGERAAVVVVWVCPMTFRNPATLAYPIRDQKSTNSRPRQQRKRRVRTD